MRNKNSEIETKSIRRHIKDYFDLLKERSKKARVSHLYQLLGLEIAEILEDEKRRSLYIKLAKQYGSEKLLRLAKLIKENKNIINKGAYFMKVIQNLKLDKKTTLK